MSINPNFNWNHGDIAPEINTTWLGIVGPGVRHLGVDRKVWSDHTDIRPTILALTGLRDDYMAAGAAISWVDTGDSSLSVANNSRSILGAPLQRASPKLLGLHPILAEETVTLVG